VFAIHDLIISESDTAIKSLFLSDFQNHVLERSQLTVGVTGAGAGVDSAWEQKKLEARKMLAEGAAESPASSATPTN
jgi:hypothetical protein